MPYDDEVQPWERQPRESAKVFALFAEFRNRGPTRSYNQFIRDTGRARQTVFEMAGRWNWNERLEAFDRHNDRMLLHEQQQAIRDMANRHARVATVMLAKATERLREVDPGTLTPTQLVQFVETAVRVERLSRGEPTEVIEEVSEGDPLVLINDPEAAAQARRLLRRVARADQSGGPGDPGDEGG